MFAKENSDLVFLTIATHRLSMQQCVDQFHVLEEISLAVLLH